MKRSTDDGIKNHCCRNHLLVVIIALSFQVKMPFMNSTRSCQKIKCSNFSFFGHRQNFGSIFDGVGVGVDRDELLHRRRRMSFEELLLFRRQVVVVEPFQRGQDLQLLLDEVFGRNFTDLRISVELDQLLSETVVLENRFWFKIRFPEQLLL